MTVLTKNITLISGAVYAGGYGLITLTEFAGGHDLAWAYAIVSVGVVVHVVAAAVKEKRSGSGEPTAG